MKRTFTFYDLFQKKKSLRPLLLLFTAKSFSCLFYSPLSETVIHADLCVASLDTKTPSDVYTYDTGVNSDDNNFFFPSWKRMLFGILFLDNTT